MKKKKLSLKKEKIANLTDAEMSFFKGGMPNLDTYDRFVSCVFECGTRQGCPDIDWEEDPNATTPVRCGG